MPLNFLSLPNTPYFCSLIGAHGNSLAGKIVRNTSREMYAIREVVDWSELGPAVNMETVWGKEGAVR